MNQKFDESIKVLKARMIDMVACYDSLKDKKTPEKRDRINKDELYLRILNINNAIKLLETKNDFFYEKRNN